MSNSEPYIVEDDDFFNHGSAEQLEDDNVMSKSEKIRDYTSINFLGFLFACFSTISFAVFLTATQTYFITDVIGLSDKLGSYVGTLGFSDELLAIILVPFIGTWSDKVGSRPIQVIGAAVIGLSLFGYGLFARSVYPGMLFWRLIFSVGASCATSTMMVMLIEMNNSNFQMQNFFKGLLKRRTSGEFEPLDAHDEEEIAQDEEDEADTPEEVNKINSTKKEGKRTSLMGIGSGLGAIFAVSTYLRLPVMFGENNPASVAMKKSYYTVGFIAFITALILYFTLYKDDNKKFFKDDIEQLFDGLEEEEELQLHKKESYLQSLKHGASISIKNPVILMSYMGSFMARVTTITVSVFIPFYINNYYFKSGKCSTKEADKLHCRDSYILASILTGISQTVALVLAPVVGILIDRINNHLHLLLITNLLSIIASVGLSFISKPDESKMIFVWVSILGLTQISFILVSMTILSNINSKEKYYSYKGSISGVYSLFGGIGILLMNKIGGLFGDLFIAGPFITLLFCNLIFLLAMFLLKGAKENDERTFKGLMAKYKNLISRRS